MDIKINISHGTLKDRIPLSRVNGINSLSLIGSINGDDIEFIRRITGGYDWTDNSKFPGPLEVLDLSNCKFVSGGIYKHTEFMGLINTQYLYTNFFKCGSVTNMAAMVMD